MLKNRTNVVVTQETNVLQKCLRACLTKLRMDKLPQEVNLVLSQLNRFTRNIFFVHFLREHSIRWLRDITAQCSALRAYEPNIPICSPAQGKNEYLKNILKFLVEMGLGAEMSWGLEGTNCATWPLRWMLSCNQSRVSCWHEIVHYVPWFSDAMQSAETSTLLLFDLSGPVH